MNFKSRISILISFLFLVLNSCKTSSENEEVNSLGKKQLPSEQGSISIPETNLSQTVSMDTSTGVHVCRISKIVFENNHTSIIVDFVNYLTGIEAHRASVIDGNYEIDNGDTITDITNDYYISNNNTKLRKFSFSSKSTIAIYDYESDGEFKQISIKEFVKRNEDNIDFYELYTIKFSGGKVTELEEIFVP